MSASRVDVLIEALRNENRDSMMRELMEEAAGMLETARAGLHLGQVLDLAERCGLRKHISGVSAEAALAEFATLVREAEPMAPEDMRPAPVAEEADENTQPREQAEERAQVLDALLDKLNSAHSLTLQYPPESQPYREAKARYAVALTDLRAVIALTQQAAPEAPTLTYEKVRKVLIRHLGWLGAMGWHDDIKAIAADLGASTGAASEAPVSEHQATVATVLENIQGVSCIDTVLPVGTRLYATPAATTASASGERMAHDFPHLMAFYSKHALGPMLPPSCLCCGKVADEVAIKHAELPGIVICRACRDAALSAPAPSRDAAPLEPIAFLALEAAREALGWAGTTADRRKALDLIGAALAQQTATGPKP